jgi:hypothetical protein
LEVAVALFLESRYWNHLAYLIWNSRELLKTGIFFVDTRNLGDSHSPMTYFIDTENMIKAYLQRMVKVTSLEISLPF